MKNLFIITSILLSAFLVSCNNEDSRETPIVGTWKLVEYFGGNSADNIGWHPIDNGYTYTFNGDGTFTSTRFSYCTQGTYILTDSKLTLKFDCTEPPGLSDNGVLIENFSWDEEYFILTPTYLFCDEGCAEKFEKQEN
ncbi:MAG: lipocalin family protein [Flavobacteriaceae bacterium]|jgi:hypothetical protein|nr:lipocalin family protein [Flavobacteriaceae bacterium]